MREFAEATRLQPNLSVSQWLKRPDESYRNLPSEIRSRFSDEVWESFETDVRYEGYIRREEAAIEKARQNEHREFPADLDYTAIAGLRAEAKQKLSKIRPVNFGQAGRISGITPSDLALVSVWLQKIGKQASP